MNETMKSCAFVQAAYLRAYMQTDRRLYTGQSHDNQVLLARWITNFLYAWGPAYTFSRRRSLAVEFILFCGTQSGLSLKETTSRYFQYVFPTLFRRTPFIDKIVAN